MKNKAPALDLRRLRIVNIQFYLFYEFNHFKKNWVIDVYRCSSYENYYSYWTVWK